MEEVLAGQFVGLLGHVFEADRARFILFGFLIPWYSFEFLELLPTEWPQSHFLLRSHRWSRSWHLRAEANLIEVVILEILKLLSQVHVTLVIRAARSMSPIKSLPHILGNLLS